MINFRRLKAVARKECIHVLRDWRSLVLALAIPVTLIVLFGYALDMDLNNVPTVVWDQARAPESRELISLFDGSPYFSIVGDYYNYRDVQKALMSGKAMIALVIPLDFAQKLRSNQETSIQVIADGGDAGTARTALGYAKAIGFIFNEKVRAIRTVSAGFETIPTSVELVPRAWYNSDLRSSDCTIPGIIAVVIVVLAAMLTSVTVAKEWETGTMEQLISTPIRVPEFVLGKIAPYILIGMLDILISVVMAQYLFGVPLRGQPALIFLTSSIFLTGALFFGLMLSITMKTQLLANQLALLASYMPTLMLSGFTFSIHNMPAPIQCLSYLFPATYFIAILKGIYLKGIGLEILWINTVLLTLYAAAMTAICMRSMKLKLE